MTPEVVVFAVWRVLGSLPVLRWPLAGGLLAIAVDIADLLVRDLVDLGGLPDYQSLDKWLDQVYMACFLVVALRWQGVERTVAVALYLFRLVGFVAFELTGDRLAAVRLSRTSSSCGSSPSRRSTTFGPGSTGRGSGSPSRSSPSRPSRRSMNGPSTSAGSSTGSARSTRSAGSGAG